METDKRFKIIRIRTDTHERLDKLHLYRRESFDEIICRLLDVFEKRNSYILSRSDRSTTHKGQLDPTDKTSMMDLGLGHILPSAEVKMNNEDYQPTESEINNLNGN